jgi:hypothetical protein
MATATDFVEELRGISTREAEIEVERAGLMEKLQSLGAERAALKEREREILEGRLKEIGGERPAPMPLAAGPDGGFALAPPPRGRPSTAGGTRPPMWLRILTFMIHHGGTATNREIGMGVPPDDERDWSEHMHSLRAILGVTMATRQKSIESIGRGVWRVTGSGRALAARLQKPASNQKPTGAEAPVGSNERR